MTPVHNTARCNPPWTVCDTMDRSKGKRKGPIASVGSGRRHREHRELEDGTSCTPRAAPDATRRSPRQRSAQPTAAAAGRRVGRLAPASTTAALLPRLTATHPQAASNMHTLHAPATPRAEDGTVRKRLTRTLDTPVAGSPELPRTLKRLSLKHYYFQHSYPFPAAVTRCSSPGPCRHRPTQLLVLQQIARTGNNKSERERPNPLWLCAAHTSMCSY
jgi:hypothetical protein